MDKWINCMSEGVKHKKGQHRVLAKTLEGIVIKILC